MSCDVKDNCFNFPDGCWVCRFSSGIGIENCYRPIDKKVVHPQLLLEKEERKRAKKEANKEKKKNKDVEKRKLLKKADKTEQRVKSTLNSGRVNKDGDLKTDLFAIDVKLQSTRLNPEIKLDEWRKIQNDALRSGKQYGVLIIENKEGQRFIVMDEETFGAFIDE